MYDTRDHGSDVELGLGKLLTDLEKIAEEAARNATSNDAAHGKPGNERGGHASGQMR